MLDTHNINRRELLRWLGLSGAAALVGGARAHQIGGFLGELTPAAATDASAATLACILSPAKTEGPYFVEERLNRSDIRVDPVDGSIQAGVPLRLTVNVYDAENTCAPVQAATVDVWHANAAGV